MSEKKHILKRVRNSALIKNPLLFEAVGLCPVVAIALSLKTAVFLALLTALEMIICEVLASLMLKNVRRYLRVALYFIFGIIIIFPIMYLATRFVPIISVDFGVFLPLTAVNSLIALHCERVAVKNTVSDSFIDAASASLSYGIVTILVGLIRELLGSGTIGGITVNLPVKFPAFLLPGGGLVILGFLAAALKMLLARKYPDKSPDRAFDMSEIRRSARGSLKELMNDDFNPYGEETEEPRPKKEKREKAKREKPERVKKEKIKKGKTKKTSENKREDIPSRPRPEFREHTYLDDFSEMLSELEEYKEHYQAEDKEDENSGGDEQ